MTLRKSEIDPSYRRRFTSPYSTRVAELKHALLSAVEPGDVTDVMKKVIAEAKEGNMFAASLLFDRLFGKVKPSDSDQSTTAEILRQIWEEIKDDGTTEPVWKEIPPKE